MKLNKRLVTGIGGAILAIIVIVVLAGASTKKKEKNWYEEKSKKALMSSPRPVRCETVKAQPCGMNRRFPGVVKASEETALSFRVGGPLTQVNVNLGTPVKKGDLLMQIDPRDFEDRILSLEAQLFGAVAVEQNARQDYKRVSDLFNDKVVSQSDYDRARSGVDSAESVVKNINVQLQIARHALEDTSLRAPYDGTVTEQQAENGEMIKSGKVVMHYHNIKTLEILVNIPENEAANASMDTANIIAHVSFPALPGNTYEARLKEWSTHADPLTRTYLSTFELEAPEGVRVMPGMSAMVQLANVAKHTRIFTVPVSALVSNHNGGSSVWIYNDARGNAQLRNVEVGELCGASRIVITDGLSEGEQVVITGSRLLHDNVSLKTAAIQ